MMTIKELLTPNNISAHNIENALVLFFKEHREIAANVIARLMNEKEGEAILKAAHEVADKHEAEVSQNLKRREEEFK